MNSRQRTDSPVKRRKGISKVITTLAVVLFAGIVAFWLIWLSPFLYTASETTRNIEQDTTHRVFAFGTLKNPFVRTIAMRGFATTEPARLPGYRRTGLDIAPEPGKFTEGVVFEVTPLQLRRLDRYERVGVVYERYLYALEDESYAWVYRRIPIDDK